MKILLVTSPHLDHSTYHRGGDQFRRSSTLRYAQCFAPMGLVSLAGAVESEAAVEIVDINKAINNNVVPLSREFYEATAEWLISYDADMIGFMTEADSYHHLLRICQKIKQRKFGILTLLGGVHATAVHRETLQHFPDVDFIIRGEGEKALLSFVQALRAEGDLKRVGNLTYRRDESIVISNDLPLIEDLDQLPFPNFSRLELTTDDVIYVEIGRGCPFKCSFCFTAPYWQRKHRIKSPARILKELAFFKSYGRTDFNFTHDLFTTDRRWVIDFCQHLHASDLNVTWTCSSRTDTIDEEQIYWMRLAGCRDIYFGVETGTSEMQAKIDKNLDLDEAERIINRSIQEGISATVGFIAGLPGESDFTLRGTLNKAMYFLGLPQTTVHLFGFSPYRGSPHFERIKPMLVFDDHFVDFPLSKETHAENCQMMSSHFEIFTRYSRLTSYEGLRVGTIRAADEFFPMINALRPLILRIISSGVDPLNLLVEWTEWIESKNRQRQHLVARLYQGTISDFLDFLKVYLESHDALDEVTEEMIRWEHLKDIFRSQTFPAPQQLPQFIHRNMMLLTNPSLHTAEFRHTDNFLADAESKPGTFAFYARNDGTPAIARLEPLTLLVLGIARQGTTPYSLVDTVETLAGIGEESQHARTAFLDLINDLGRKHLLVAADQ